MKKILIIYYNYSQDKFYYHFYENAIDLLIHDKYVGKTNQYNHEIVQILVLENGFLNSIKDYYDYSSLDKREHKNSSSLLYKLFRKE